MSSSAWCCRITPFISAASGLRLSFFTHLFATRICQSCRRELDIIFVRWVSGCMTEAELRDTRYVQLLRDY